jgi:hypothetical protein
MIKIPLVTKVKSHGTIIVKNKGYWMKKNSIVDEVIFDSIIYVLLHASKMQLL